MRSQKAKMSDGRLSYFLRLISCSLLFTSYFLLPTSHLSPAFAQNEQGKALYERWCAQCHGPDGDGKGYAAERVDPRPLDLTRGLYKFKGTPSGQLPLDDDLYRTVSRGLQDTAMPSFESLLSEEERRQVVQYIKTFSPRFARTKDRPQPIQIGPRIASSAESIAKGRQLFHELECFACHGEEGRGNGLLALELTDDWGYPIRPANLTKPWNYRGGSRPEDIYIRLHSGVAGAPMPSFADGLDNEKTWHLVNYVMSRQEERKLDISLRGKRVPKLALDPEDPIWDSSDYLDIPMVGQIIVEPRMYTPRVDNVRIRALYTDTDIGVLLEWDDPHTNKGENTPPDGIGIQFPVKLSGGVAKPYFGMGDRDHPVYIWAWWANSGEALEYNARGTRKEEITRQPRSDLVLRSVYKDGRYRVAFYRELTTRDDNKIEFRPGEFIPFALMASDGDNGEEKGKKAISAWYYLLLEPSIPFSAYLVPPLIGLFVVTAELWITRTVQRKKGMM